jgi:hypothetical protein
MPNKRQIRKYAKSKKSLIPNVPEKEDTPPTIVFTLHQIDKNQGQTLKEWEESSLLLPAIERLANLCTMTLALAITKGIIKVYNTFPPSDQTDFKHPKHIPNDAKWCSINVHGRVRIPGHIVKNHIINIVFLDKDHRFWKSKKKNT